MKNKLKQWLINSAILDIEKWSMLFLPLMIYFYVDFIDNTFIKMIAIAILWVLILIYYEFALEVYKREKK